MRPALLLLLFALPFTSVAQDCGQDSEQRILRAYQQRQAGELPVRSGFTVAANQGACRVWPADTALTLMAVPVLADTPDGGADQDGDLDLLVVDSATLRPRATLRLANEISSDAIRFDRVSLDTARYQLSTDTRAFGVRTQRSNSSQPNPFNDTQLQLFALNGNALEAVTERMVVAHFNGEWDTRCSGDFIDIKRTLELSPPPAQGFAQMHVRERYTTTRNVEDANGNCVDDKKQQPIRSYQLRPQGRHYPLPDALKATF